MLCLVVQSCLTLCDPVDCNPQAPLSMGFSRHEYCSGLPCPFLGDLPNPGIEPRDWTQVSPQGRQILYHLKHQGSPLSRWLLVIKGDNRAVILRIKKYQILDATPVSSLHSVETASWFVDAISLWLCYLHCIYICKCLGLSSIKMDMDLKKKKKDWPYIYHPVWDVYECW